MTMLSQRAVVAAEIEAVEGTAETLVAADAGFLVFNPKFDPDIAMHERDPVRASLSAVKALPGARQARMTFDTELVGSAAAGTAPLISDLLQGCGFGETIVASTSVTYAPASASIKSLTLGMWLDGKKYLLWGARGNVTLRLEAGKPGILSFDFLGADWSEADEALLAAVTYVATLPPVFLSAGLTISAYSAIISMVEFAMNNALQLRPDANKASGFASCVITNRKMTMRLDPENITVATEPFMTDWRAGTEAAFACSIGSVAGNTIAIAASKVQYSKISLDDRGGVSALGIEGQLNLTSGDDEFSIAIT